MTLEQALIEVVNDWYSDWHRSAEEDEDPPKHVQVIIHHLLVKLGGQITASLYIPADLIK